MESEKIIQLCEEIWQIRLAQNNHLALSLYSSLVKPNLDMRQINKMNEEQCAMLVSFVPIKSSIDRLMQKDDPQTEVLFIKLEQLIAARICPARFVFWFERGLRFFMHGAYEQAIEYFYRAQALATNLTQILATKLNTSFCHDQLGLPLQKIWDEVLQLKQENAAHLLNDTFSALVRQIDAFELRQGFRRGDVVPFNAMSDSATFDQKKYLTAWIAALPFHRYSLKNGAEFISLFQQTNSHVLFKNYRCRTLAGFTHSDDSHTVVKVSEVIDRLYLWLWRWLEEESGSSLDKVLATLNSLELTHLEKSTTAEDRALLANALSWLCLFDPRYENALSTFFARYPSGSISFPLLEFEAQVIAYLRARRDRHHSVMEDSLEMLKLSPLWEHPDVYLRHLVNADSTIQPPGLEVQPLSNTLKKLGEVFRSSKSQMNDGACLVVDPEAFSIENSDTQVKAVSEEMVRAVNLLRYSGNCRVEEFCEQCFGLKNYDPGIHQQRVANLLYRIRLIIKPLGEIKFKQQKILLNLEPSRIRFVESSKAQRIIAQSTAWQNLLNQLSGYTKSGVHARISSILVQPTFKRSDIEEASGKSKATINRWIRTLEHQGLVFREGKAKALLYRTHDKLRCLAARGEVTL